MEKTKLQEVVADIINRRIDFMSTLKGKRQYWIMGEGYINKALKDVYDIDNFDRWNDGHQKALRFVEDEFSKYIKPVYIDRQLEYAIRTTAIKKRLNERRK